MPAVKKASDHTDVDMFAPAPQFNSSVTFIDKVLYTVDCFKLAALQY